MATLTQEAPTETQTQTQMEVQVPQVNTGGKELISQALPVLTRAFRDDTIFMYMMIGLSEEARLKTLEIFLKALLKGSVMNEGLILELSNWGCCAVLLPPGRKMDNPMTALQAGLMRILMSVKGKGVKHILEHGAAVKKARQKVFPSRKQLSSPAYWYLFIIGTEPSRQGQGLGGAMLEYLKGHVKKSSKPHLPLWLESSSEGSRKLYKRHGFEDVDEMTLGIGVVGPDGRAKKNGEGVKTWGMIWRPDGK